jgi:hypothetical protein
MSLTISQFPSGNPRECDPEFPTPPTSKRFYLRNGKRPFTNFIRAEITKLGYLGNESERTAMGGAQEAGCSKWLEALTQASA